MTLIEIRQKILMVDSSITFYIPTRQLMLDTEKLLLANGWEWNGMGHNRPLIETRSEFNGKTSIMLYSNYIHRDGQKRKLTYSSLIPTRIGDDVIQISDEMLKYMKLVLNPVPNYNPRKIVKEI